MYPYKYISRNRSMRQRGRGLLNKAINKLPFELHLPGYNYCGPGTKLKRRLARGDVGINELDEACKEHDIAYDLTKSLSGRHEADKKLYRVAKRRIGSAQASVGEKVASSVVAGAMKIKTKFGMGVMKRKFKKKSFTKLRRKTKRGSALSFNQAMRIARQAVSKNKSKGVFGTTKTAYNVLKNFRRGIKYPKRRIIPIPKRGGFLPLIPLFAALGALGSLGGGAAAIAKAVNQAKTAKDQLQEAQRHNRAIEAKAVGSGFYIKPYKKGCGLYLPDNSKN